MGLWYDYNFFASIQIPSAQSQVYYTAKTSQLVTKGNYRTINVKFILVTWVFPKRAISVSTFPFFPSMFHICAAFLITLKSPQVSVSASAYVLLIIERLFYELSTSDPERGEEISITFVAFIERHADRGLHNPPSPSLKAISPPLGGSLRAARSVSLDLPLLTTVLEDEVEEASYSTSYLIL